MTEPRSQNCPADLEELPLPAPRVTQPRWPRHGADPSDATVVPAPPSGPTRGALIARLLLAVMMIAGLIGTGLIAVDWEPRLLPVRVVTIDGEVRSLSRQTLQETIAGHMQGGILTQDLAALQAEVEALPWVRTASLRRIWPDRIELSVTEHEAIARWGENGLVTADGHVFRPRDGRLPAGLPLLSGADEDAPIVVEQFAAWHPKLAELGLVIDAMHHDARGDWSLELLGGTELFVGTEDVDARFERLLEAYPQVEAIGIPTRIDLRYSNGFAVRWMPLDENGTGGRPDRVAANN